MAFEVSSTNDRLKVELTGWDRLLTWRRSLVIDLAAVGNAFVDARGALEAGVDHRASGFGTHDGRQRPGRRRVGTMLGRAVRGRQFWAASSGPLTTRLLVLELDFGLFERVVLEVDGDVGSQILAAVGTR